MRDVWAFVRCREPAAVAAFIAAAISLLTAYGVHLTFDQAMSTSTFLFAMFGLVARKAVWSPHKHARAVDDALRRCCHEH